MFNKKYKNLDLNRARPLNELIISNAKLIKKSIQSYTSESVFKHYFECMSL